MTAKRNYEFSWELLGNISEGRPNLGAFTRLEVYRLMQFTFRDILEKRFGTEQTDRVFYEAGELAGKEFYKHLIGEIVDFQDFIKQLQKLLREMGIGILRVEKADMENGQFILTVSEDLDCSGLPEMGNAICTYDEGFISALLESYTGSRFAVKEVDCWCTGDRTCRFSAERMKQVD